MIKIIFTAIVFIVFFYFLIKKEQKENTSIIRIDRRKRKQRHKKRHQNKGKALYTRTFKNDFTSAYIEASWEEIEKHY